MQETVTGFTKARKRTQNGTLPSLKQPEQEPLKEPWQGTLQEPWPFKEAQTSLQKVTQKGTRNLKYLNLKPQTLNPQLKTLTGLFTEGLKDAGR